MNNQDGIKKYIDELQALYPQMDEEKEKKETEKNKLAHTTHKLRLNSLICAVCRLLDNLRVKEGSSKKKKNLKTERTYGDISVQKKDTHKERRTSYLGCTMPEVNLTSGSLLLYTL